MQSTKQGASPSRSGPVDRRLLKELPVIRVSLVVSVALGLVSTGAIVVQALALARLLAGAMRGGRPIDGVADLVLLGAAAVVRALVALASELVARISAATAKAQLRQRLLAGLVFSAKKGKGPVPLSVATIAGRGLDGLDVYLGRCLPDLVLAAAAPLALVTAIGALDWLSALVLLVAIALFPLFGALVGRATMALATDRWRQLESLGHQVTDIFLGLPVLRAFGLSAAQRERIARANEALRVASSMTLRVAFLSALVLDTLASVSVALVAVPLGLRLLDGSIPLSSALAVLIIAPEVLLPMRRATAEFHESTEGLAASARALSALAPVSSEHESDPVASGVGKRGVAVPGEPGRAVPDPASVPVALCSVRVELAGRAEPLFDGASLTIGPGETIALVGGNGAGKSTVAALLLGFVAPQGGSVRAGDTDLREIDLRVWRQKLAYLPEHPTLLGATLADNLRLASPLARDEELAFALERAGAGSFLAALPDGLATCLGDGGRLVSAGERQRIALARILLRPASLYVLDEPTVHLDPDSEGAVIEELAQLLNEKSALIVTHRPAVLRIADRVLRVAHGEIVEVPLESAADLAHETDHELALARFDQLDPRRASASVSP